VQSINQPGSTFYYSYRLLNANDQNVLAALFELQYELKALTRIKSEKTVAYTKLHWWNEEIVRLQQQKPRHPITKTLAPTSFAAENIALLESLLVAAKMDLDYDSYPDYLTLCQYLDQSQGSVIQAATIVCGAKQTEFGTYLGRATAMTRYLQNLAQDIANGMLYLPLSDLKTHQLRPEDLGMPAASAQTHELCQLYAQRADESFSKAYASLDSQVVNQQTSNLVFGNLHQALLTHLKRNRFAVFDKNISLSPIKKLWVSMLTNPKKIVRQ